MKNAIIMGAGPAGLTAAWELLTRTDIKPVIIEMDNQVGGLSRTIDYKGNGIDIGGHRFFSRSEKVVRWWLNQLPLDPSVDTANLDITYQHQHAVFHLDGELKNAGKGKMLLRPRKSRIYFNKTFFDYPLSLNKSTLNNFGFVKLSRIGASYVRSKLFPKKAENSLEDFFINRFGQELYQTFFKGYTEKVWGVPCRDIPADWGRQRIKDLNIGKAVASALRSVFVSDKSLQQKKVSTGLIEQFLYPEKGPGQLWEAVAGQIIKRGGEIRLGCKVEQLHLSGNTVKGISFSSAATGRKRLDGDYFFSGIPMRELVSAIDNPVPSPIAEIAAGLAYRDFMIVGLLFDNADLSRKGKLAGITDNWIYLQDASVVAGRLQVFNNWSPAMVADPGTQWLGMEYFCSENDPMWKSANEDIIAKAAAELRGTGLIGEEKLIDGTVIRVPKAYPSYTGSYARFDELRAYFDQFPNLFLIGRNGMHRYNNTDHSMMTAMTAVDNIVAGSTDKANLWAVNMEADYHESK